MEEGRMTRSSRSALLASFAVVAALVLPGVANASTNLWVSGTTPVGNDTSCSSPGYETVQAALNAATSGEKVNVCGGTYTEQIEIVKPVKLQLALGSSKATLQMPSEPSDSLTSCDTAPGLEAGQKDEVSICTAGKVSITGLKIVALAPIETCAGGLNGVNVAGGAELTLEESQILGASTTLDAFKGCQHGLALDVGSHKANLVGHAKLLRDTISGYEKNGPTVSNPGSTLSTKEVTVSGEGPSPWIAQNGIEVAFGAKGSIQTTNVSGNECELAGTCSSGALGEQATGVLFFGAAAGSKAGEDTITGNDIGAYYASTSPTQPAKPEVNFAFDKLVSNRYEGFVLEEGTASLKSDSITGTSLIGIDIVQSASQPYADNSKANGLTIEGMSDAAVNVATDKEPGDPAGTFKIQNSSISKNAAAVVNPSANYTVAQKNDS
jgi:hypothetical protein